MKNNIKKQYGILFMIGLLFIAVYWYIGTKNNNPRVCNKNVCIAVELARTAEEKEKGLMYRESLAITSGMLFVFSGIDFYDFWMKDTHISLDMIWIDEKNTVVRVLTAQPCITTVCPVYKPEVFSKYVLEINAGIAKKYGIIEGSKVKIQI